MEIQQTKTQPPAFLSNLLETEGACCCHEARVEILQANIAYCIIAVHIAVKCNGCKYAILCSLDAQQMVNFIHRQLYLFIIFQTTVSLPNNKNPIQTYNNANFHPSTQLHVTMLQANLSCVFPLFLPIHVSPQNVLVLRTRENWLTEGNRETNGFLMTSPASML